jgi:hypothetical protein
MHAVRCIALLTKPQELSQKTRGGGSHHKNRCCTFAACCDFAWMSAAAKKKKKAGGKGGGEDSPSALGPLGSGAMSGGGAAAGWLVAKEAIKRGSTSDGDLLDFVHAAVQLHPSDFEVCGIPPPPTHPLSRTPVHPLNTCSSAKCTSVINKLHSRTEHCAPPCAHL